MAQENGERGKEQRQRGAGMRVANEESVARNQLRFDCDWTFEMDLKEVVIFCRGRLFESEITFVCRIE